MLGGFCPSTRTQGVLVGIALAAVLAGATTAAALVPAPDAAPARVAADAPDRPAAVVPKRVAVPPPVPAPPQAAPAVAPMGALHVPDVVVRSATPLAPETVQALQALDGVTGLALLDAGTVQLAGEPSQLIGVDPSQFRGFVPPETAASDPLWQAVARGDLAVSPALAQQRSLPLGGSVDAGRVGAIAVFGAASGEVVASREVARALGAVPDSVVVLSAPETGRSALEQAVRAVADDADVEVLRPADVAVSQVAAASNGKPRDYRELYIDSARYCPGLSWTVLAAIGQVESGHGKNLGPSSAGALGPMQFLPPTWGQYGIDGDGDGRADIMSPFDAVPSAARYLCASGAQKGEQGLYDAIFAYNRSDSYVRKVLGIAAQYS